MKLFSRTLVGSLVLSVALPLMGILAGPANAVTYVAADEAKVQNLVNGTRAAKGLSTLSRNDALVSMARSQAARMAQQGSIFHNGNLGGEVNQLLGSVWRLVGENVGMGPNVDVIENAFLASPRHYENIVKPQYNSIGIGVVQAGSTMFVTQIFADLEAATPAAPAPAPAKPAPAPEAPAPPAAAPDPTPEPAPVATPEPASVDPNGVTGGVTGSDPIPGAAPVSTEPLSTEPATSEPEARSLLDVVLGLLGTLIFWA